MKQIITLLILLNVVNLAPTHAQERVLGGPQKQRIEQAKIAFITRQMKLSTEEARIFWPIYDQYQDRLEQQKRARRQQLAEIRDDMEGMTDDKANAIINSRLQQAEEALNARKAFVEDLRAQLSPRKVLAYLRAEEMFRKELAERAAKLRQERKGTDAPGLRR